MVLSPPLQTLQDVASALAWLRGRGVRRLVVDSRAVRPGDAFIAWPGAAHDARRFVARALDAGALACLVDAEGIEAHLGDGVPLDDDRVAAFSDLKHRLGDLASAFEGHPTRSMEMVAFTGTNGKTSSTWWMAQASSLLGRRAGFVGTLGIGEARVSSAEAGGAPAWTATGLTTPDPVTLQHALARQMEQGWARCAIEASSIGIVEGRLQGSDIAVAVLTNFTQDHLDYHGSMAAYWAAKRRLFDWPTLRAAVLNVDDEHGCRLAQELAAAGWGKADGRTLWTVAIDAAARLRACDLKVTAQGMGFRVVEQGGATVDVCVPFIGRYNVHNLLGVMAALRALGHGLSEVASVLPRLSAVPGRMEWRGGLAHPSGQPLVVIDYAHTPDALEQALRALRPVAEARGGRLWAVFGCGGDRDRSKRAQMGAVAARCADRVVLTSDNPRSEPPQAILDDIRAGLPLSTAGQGAQAFLDRGQAIAAAVAWSDVQDVVLVAGKGHEDYQEIQGVRHPCRDADLVEAALRDRDGDAARAGLMSLESVARALPGSRLVGSGDLWVRRVHTDTRTLQEGDLYVALRGERFDGHAFIDEALLRGAVAVLAESGLDAQDRPGVEVADSLCGLQDLARHWRTRLQLPLIAITGSNGKTTTTQMVASILRAWLGPQAAATRGNLNNHIGVPLTVLSLRGGDGPLAHRAAVVELGMNHPGEIATLAAISQPTVALVNNAQREHQEFMGTVEAVARENGAVLQALGAGGVAVFPARDEYAELWRGMAGDARVWRFAVNGDASDSAGASPVPAEVMAHAQAVDDGWQVTLQTPCGEIRTLLRVSGAHNLHNAVAAATVSLAAGAPGWAVAAGLAAFEPVAGRSVRIALQRGGRAVTLIDDSYNANPDSVRAAIDLLASMPGPRALLLGDMGEVGEQGPAFHAEVGAYAAARGIEHVACVGELCAHAAAACAGAQHFGTVEALIQSLPQWPWASSMLVKGSRFMRMERVVQALKADGEGR